MRLEADEPLRSLALLVAILLSLLVVSCARVEDLQYDSKADRQKLVQLRGKRVPVLSIQYDTRPKVGREALDPSAVELILDHYNSVLAGEFRNVFIIGEVLTGGANVGSPRIDVNNSQQTAQFIRSLDVDGGFVITTSYGFDFNTARAGVSSYYFASNTYLVDREGQMVWNFYGKASASAIPDLPAALDLEDFARSFAGARPSERTQVQAMKLIAEQYAPYLRWLMEADMQGLSTKNYFADYPDGRKNKYIAIFPASAERWAPFLRE